MLVLLNRPEEIDTHLTELREIAAAHGITKICLSRLSLSYGSRVRSIVAPHKLARAARMSDAAANNYLFKIAEDLRNEGLDIETVSTGIPITEIDGFVKKNEVNMVVTSDGRLGMCRWSSAVSLGIQVPLLYEHVFCLGQSIPQRQFHGDGTISQEPKSRKVRDRKKDIK